MSVINGQPGNEDTFNNAFGSKQRANTYTGIQSLKHAGSGGDIENIQKLANDMMVSLGFSAEVDANRDVYDAVVENLYAIANGQNRKVAIKNLDAAMKEIADRTSSLEGNIPSHNLEATEDPTAMDGVGSGWLPGSGWLNTTTGDYFICIDNTAEEAVWVKIGDTTEIKTSAIYMGDPEVDGTWRIVPDGADLNFEVRESGTWTWKQKITP